MDSHIKDRNRLLAELVIRGLRSRNMSGYFVEDKEEALQKALSLIPEGSSVSMGGCMSAREIGLVDALKAGPYHFIDRYDYEVQEEGEKAGHFVDVFLASANAMTNNGMIVNIDGHANRISAIANGPEKVLLIVGMNKICPDLDTAMKRARNVAGTINVRRHNLNTPCSKTGACFDCLQPDTICCQILITRYSRHKDRIHVILVNDNLGF